MEKKDSGAEQQTVFQFVQRMEASPEEIFISYAEALRYMGCGNVLSATSVPKDSDAGRIKDGNILRNEEILLLCSSCEEELRLALRPSCCYVRVPITFPSQYAVDLGFGSVDSVSLWKHLQGCREAVLMAATIGIEVDRLIARKSRLFPSRAVVLDALASAAVESWCDLAEERMDLGPHCDRFSPGYGDLPLECQADLGRRLDMFRNAGIGLSSSLLMVPSKSVTAVIGLGLMRKTCGHKCFSCTKKNCIYRNGSL